MAQFTDLMAQRAGVEAKAYGKLYAMLDPKQQAKAGPVFADKWMACSMAAAGAAEDRGNRHDETNSVPVAWR